MLIELRLWYNETAMFLSIYTAPRVKLSMYTAPRVKLSIYTAPRIKLSICTAPRVKWALELFLFVTVCRFSSFHVTPYATIFTPYQKRSASFQWVNTGPQGWRVWLRVITILGWGLYTIFLKIWNLHPMPRNTCHIATPWCIILISI